MSACRWCGGDAPEETCPRRVHCPTCGSGPGSPCYRPSGHRAPKMHQQRIQTAERAGVTHLDIVVHPDQETLLP